MLEKIIQTERIQESNAFAFEVARYEIERHHKISVCETLQITEQLRKAIIKHRISNEHSEAIIGKTIDGIPLKGHQHAHYFATDEDKDSFVDHLTVYVPRGLNEADIEALQEIHSIALPWRRERIKVDFTGTGGRLSFSTKIFAKSNRWRSVTPFSLPYYPTRGGGSKTARPKDSPEGQLRRELRKRGLPEPVRVTATRGFFETLAPIANVGEKTPRFRWLEFAHRRFNGTAGNGLAGFEIEFAPEDADKINQPLALGFGSHFGLGLFLPVIGDF